MTPTGIVCHYVQYIAYVFLRQDGIVGLQSVGYCACCRGQSVQRDNGYLLVASATICGKYVVYIVVKRRN